MGSRYIDAGTEPSLVLGLGDGRVMVTAQQADWGIQGDPTDVVKWMTKAFIDVIGQCDPKELRALFSAQIMDATAELNREANEDSRFDGLRDKTNDLTVDFLDLLNFAEEEGH